MHAQDLMNHPVVTCHVNDTLKTATQRMWDADCGAIPIVNDDGKLTGIITDRDIAMAAWLQGRLLDDILVNSVMSKHVVSAHEDQAVGDVAQLMAKHQIRRVPVVDRDERPVGMLSLNDLAVESAQRDSRMKHATQKVCHTLAAICQHRTSKEQVA